MPADLNAGVRVMKGGELAAREREHTNARKAATTRAAVLRYQREREPLMKLIRNNDVSAMEALCRSIAEERGIAIEVRDVMPAAAHGGRVSAFASGKAGERGCRIVVMPMRSMVDGAVWAHEIGHTLAEPCRGPQHQPDRSEKVWHHCLRCETAAWERALKLAPFSRPMFARMRQSLIGFYAKNTPAPAVVLKAASAVTSDMNYADERLARIAADDRNARLDRILFNSTKSSLEIARNHAH